MTVQITKPITNLREELNDLRKPSGVAGESILRAETPHDAFNIIGAGRKNLFINGSLNFWQRGTSFSSISNSGNTADRWTSHATVDGSRQSFTVGQKEVPGEPKYFARHSAVTNAVGFHQKIEDVRTGAGQTITFSFWAKASKVMTGDVLFRQRFGSGGSSTVFEDLTDAITLTTHWQYFTFTHRMQDIHGKTIGNSSFLEVGVYFDGRSAGDSIDFAQAQCELGRVATPFEFRHHAEELALCKRYYEKSYVQGTDPGTANTYPGAIFFTAAHNNHREEIRYEVEKRATATVTLYASSDGSTGFWYSHQDNTKKAVVATHGNGARGVRVDVTTIDGHRMDGHFTADAEL